MKVGKFRFTMKSTGTTLSFLLCLSNVNTPTCIVTISHFDVCMLLVIEAYTIKHSGLPIIFLYTEIISNYFPFICLSI